jgi:hypothetical protein
MQKKYQLTWTLIPWGVGLRLASMRMTQVGTGL